MRMRLILTGILLVVAISGIGVIAYEFQLRENYRIANMADPQINNMIIYNRQVYRTPNSTLRYRLLTVGGEVVASADPPLNNLGLFSHHDYKIGPDRPEGLRITIIGGEQTASSVATTSWPDYLQDELRTRLEREDVFIYNIAWPDAGPKHYIRYWKEFGEKIQPSITIVNMVETDYYRYTEGDIPDFTYLDQPIGGSVHVEYKLADGVAKNTSKYIGKKPEKSLDFSNPKIIPSRPYGFIVSGAAILNSQALGTLQQRVVADMVDGTIEIIGCFVCKKIEGKDLLNATYSVHNIRNFQTKNIATASQPDILRLAQFGAQTFGWMAEKIPSILFTHSFTAHEINASFPVTAEMQRIAPQIQVVDMRKRLPSGTTPQDIAPWYQSYMPEKWSDAGHRAYARMMADLVLEHLQSRHAEQAGN